MAASDMTETSVADDRLARIVSSVTTEHVAYIGIAVLAAVLRFTDIGMAPLSPDEAEHALAVWEQWQPGSPAVVPGSPAYFTLSALLTQIAGFSDGVMRLVPSLFGFALVLTPWFVRHRTGRLGALLSTLLLALSPLQILTARTAGGTSIALFAGMMVFVAWLRFQESGHPHWLYALTGALALGLASAPLFFAILLTLLVAWLAQRVIGPALIHDDAGQRAPIARPTTVELRNALLIGLAVFLAIGTALLLAIRGLGAAADLLANWLSLFRFVSSAYVMTGPFAVLLRYEVGLVIFGVVAAIWAAIREKPFAIYLVYWALGALLLMLLQPGAMDNVLLLTVPGYLLVGRFANDIFSRTSASWWWAVGLAIVLAGAVVYLNLVRYARLAGLTGVPDPTYHLLIAVLALVTAVIVVLLVGSWDRAAATKGVLFGTLALLLVVSWGSAWWLSREAANDTRERLVSTGTDVDIRLVRDTVEELSWRASNSVNDVVLSSAVDSPALRWYLRDFDQATFATSLPSTAASPVLITPLDYDPAVAGNYIGTEYSYAHPETVHRLEKFDALRWWLFRQSPIPISEEYLVLWLRSDLAEAGP
jgi:predicted membrane-bound mannosyltransferase